MIFTPQKIEEILRIIQFNHTMFIGTNVGTNVLTKEDIKLLKQFGIDLKDLKTAFTPYEQNFYFGRLAQALGNENASKLKYNDFQKYLRSGQYIPLNSREKATLDYAKQRTYGHIKNLGQRITQDVNGIIINESQATRDEYENTIKNSIERAILERDTINSVVSEIGNKTGDWNRDLGRIAATEMQDIYEEGRAAEAERIGGKETKVYKEAYPQACRFCIKFYTTGGIGSKPVVFELSELRANGTNVGKKQAQWSATLGSVHPWCFDKDTDVLTNEGWKNWRDVTGDESFLSPNPENKNIEWVKANKLVKYMYKGKLNHFKGFSFDLMVTPNHNHFIKKKSSFSNKTNSYYKYKLGDLSDIGKGDALVNIFGDWKGNETDYFENSGYKFKFDDYCELMGWWLSDGSISKPLKAKNWQLKITQEKPHNRPIIEEILKKCFGTVWVGKGAFYAPIEDGLANYFLQFGHAHEKFIPFEIKNSSKRQIKLFLRAFIGGDGSVRKRSNEKINSKKEIYCSTSSIKLASDLSELAIKIEYRPIDHITPPRLTKFKNGMYMPKRDQIDVYFRRSQSSTFNKLNFEEIYYNDYVYDVELEKNHLLYVKRNGKVTISGNCRCELQYIPDGYIWDEELQRFNPPKRDKDKPKRGIKITVGDKVFEV